MAFSRLKLALCSLISGVALAQVPAAFAQDTSPIRLVVGAPPGGTTDTVARSIAQQLNKTMGRTVMVENKPGAGGNIAANYVAKSPNDGTTLLVSFSSFSINASLYKNLQFDPNTDFTPVSMLAKVPNVLVVRKDFPADTMEQFLSLVRSNPGKYTMALGSIGSSLHMAGERMKMMGQLDILNVPYKGTAPALTDLLGGQVDMMFASTMNVLPHTKAGSLKVLGVSSEYALDQFPGVPPIGASIKDFESTAWFGLFGPKDLPATVLQNLNTHVAKAVASDEFRQLLETDAARPQSSTPQELSTFVAEDIKRYAEVVKFTGATAD